VKFRLFKSKNLTTNIFEEFKSKWDLEKLDVRTGNTAAEIIDCFEYFGVSPSDQLINLYTTLDGKDEMDGEHFRLWSLQEIREDNDSVEKCERTRKYGVIFADYLVNCWCYRISKTGEIFIDYFSDDRPPELRAISLLEFFKLMQNNPDDALI